MSVKEAVSPGRDTDPAAPGYLAVDAFREVAGQVAREEDLDAVLHVVAEKVSSLIGISRCSIFLRDKEGPLLLGAVGYSPSVDDKIKQLVSGTESDRFSREIVETRRPVLVTDTRTDPRVIRHRMLEWSVRSMLGVPMLVEDEVLGIMYLDNADMSFTFTEEHQTLAATFANLAAVAVVNAELISELRASVKLVESKNRLLVRSAAIEDRLTHLVLRGADVGQIVRAVSEMTGKPCAVCDTNYEVLASHQPDGGAWQPPIVNPELRAHQQVEGALVSLWESSSTVLSPVLAAGLRHRMIAAPLQARDERIGTFWIEERPAAFGPLDRMVARHAATVLALELASARRAAAAEHDARVSLTTDLLRGSGDTSTLERRASYLGMSLNEPYTVCLFRSNRPGDPIPPSEVLEEAFAQALPGRKVLSAAVAEGTAVLVSVESNAPRRTAVDAVVAAAGQVAEALGDDVRVAVSSACTGADGAMRAYHEVRAVAACQVALGHRAKTALGADDLGPARLLLSSGDEAAVDRFVEDTFGDLHLAGQTHADLLSTLGVFFDVTQSVKRSAETLGVHENTVRYRLKRVEELTGLCLGRPEALMSLQLAIMVSRLRGDPRVLPSAGSSPDLLAAEAIADDEGPSV